MIALVVQVKAILRWISVTSETLPSRGYEQAFGVWTGKDFLTILDQHFGINEGTLQLYKVRVAVLQGLGVKGLGFEGFEALL